MLESDGNYFFAHSEGKDTDLVKTPAGNAVRTSYRDLADRILNDLDRLGYNYRSPESILAWHFTMIDNFSRMDHSDVEEILDQSFMQRNDWTFEENQDDESWTAVFGEEESRNDIIREWLSNCTHMQLTAACCIGNAYHSINIAFVLARLMENYEGDKLKQKFIHLARQIAESSVYGPAEDIIGDFTTFELYYGIHLNEEGKIINEELDDDGESDKVDGIKFTVVGDGVNQTVTTNSKGEIQIDNLMPGTYTVTEQTYDKYVPQETHRVTVLAGQTATVSFNNVLRRGDLTVTKTSEDGLVEGVKFHLYGTSVSGLAVDEFAVTNSKGVATFKDVLIGSGYTLEELNALLNLDKKENEIVDGERGEEEPQRSSDERER